MAERHDAKAVLRIARGLVQRVQDLIDNKWLIMIHASQLFSTFTSKVEYTKICVFFTEIKIECS